MARGRPTKYRPEYCDVAERILGQGYSQEVLAGELDVDEDTITNWKKAHEDFFGAIKRGLYKGRKFWEKMGIDGAQGKIDGFNATTWIFNMKNRFSDSWRDRHEVTGKGGGPIQSEVKTLQILPVKADNADSDS